jgi:hypothetical protein
MESRLLSSNDSFPTSNIEIKEEISVRKTPGVDEDYLATKRGENQCAVW